MALAFSSLTSFRRVTLDISINSVHHILTRNILEKSVKSLDHMITFLTPLNILEKSTFFFF